MATMYGITGLMIFKIIITATSLIARRSCGLEIVIRNNHGDYYQQKLITNKANVIEIQWTTEDESQISMLIDYSKVS